MIKTARLVRTVAASLLLVGSAACWAQKAPDLGELLKATGLKYQAIEGQEDAWRVPFEGDNGRQIDVYVAYNNENKHFALIFTTVIDREDNFQFNREVLAECMRLNNDYPGIKFVLDEKHGDIDCQTEVYMKTITAESLNMYINLVAAMADEKAEKLNQLAGGGGEGAAPQPPANPTAATATPSKIAWLTNLDEAKQAAAAQNKPIMIDFFATWCGPCRMLEQQTYADSRVINEAAKFISVKIDIDKERALAQQFKIEAVPTIVFLNAQGKELRRHVGYVNAEQMLQLMRGQ